LFNKKLKINSLPGLLDKQETNVSGLQDDGSMKDSVTIGSSNTTKQILLPQSTTKRVMLKMQSVASGSRYGFKIMLMNQ
jgi:hypothetical protein